jgi:hypothetical protein
MYLKSVRWRGGYGQILNPWDAGVGDGGSKPGRSANWKARAEFMGCGGGIDERPREEGFFASLSPPIFGKTEVTRELD